MPAPLVSIVIANYNYAEYLAEANHIRSVILASNLGQAAGYQAGFEVCRGDLICFLDSDDRLASDAVERVVAV